MKKLDDAAAAFGPVTIPVTAEFKHKWLKDWLDARGLIADGATETGKTPKTNAHVVLPEGNTAITSISLGKIGDPVPNKM